MSSCIAAEESGKCQARVARRLCAGAGRVWPDCCRVPSRQPVDTDGGQPWGQRRDGRAGGDRNGLVALVTGLLITPPPKYRSPLGTDVLFCPADRLQPDGGLRQFAGVSAAGTPAAGDSDRRVLVDVDRHGDASGACRVGAESAGGDLLRRVDSDRSGCAAGQLSGRPDRLAQRLYSLYGPKRSGAAVATVGAALNAPGKRRQLCYAV